LLQQVRKAPDSFADVARKNSQDPGSAPNGGDLDFFGRGAMGERISNGAFRDSWRIKRGGQLVFADEVSIDGTMSDRLDRPAVGAGARAVATFLHLAPDAEARLDAARLALENSLCECGASAWNGMLIARFVAVDPSALRQSATRFLNQFRAVPVPRVWQC
jgi:urease accessory protein